MFLFYISIESDFVSSAVLRFVKPVKEYKDDSWRDATAELTLKVVY